MSTALELGHRGWQPYLEASHRRTATPYTTLPEVGELDDLERVVSRALKSWTQAQKTSPEQDVYLDSVALNLHIEHPEHLECFEQARR